MSLPKCKSENSDPSYNIGPISLSYLHRQSCTNEKDCGVWTQASSTLWLQMYIQNFTAEFIYKCIAQ